MGRIDILGIPREMVGVKQQGVKQATSSPLGWTSIIEGQVRIGGTAILLVDSSGGIVVHGTISGDGTITWTGVFNLSGSLNVTGTLALSGAATLASTLTVNSPGKIVAAGSDPMTMGAVVGGLPGLLFGSGGHLVTDGSGGILMSASSGGIITAATTVAQMAMGGKSVVVASSGTTVNGDLNITGTMSAHSKTFKIPHPLKDNTWLVHGVTEAPVHGVEYWGQGAIGADGIAKVDLPDYFEALTSKDGRAILVTGRGCSPDWTDIADGSFTVTGKPGARFDWLVKAKRSDVELVVELPMEEESAAA